MINESRTVAATEHFPRTRRLSQADEFKWVFAAHGRFEGASFVVSARVNKHCSYARLGLAISKRNCPRAVDRNRLKRIVRESFRLHARVLPAIDIVVLCNPKARLLSNCDLFAGLNRVWKKVMNKTWLEC